MGPTEELAPANERIIYQLEAFFSSPEFTSAVGDWMSKHAARLEYIDLEQEQPINNHALFQQYQQLIEEQLVAFFDEQGLSQEEVLAACYEATSKTGQFTCIDYLLASTEYEHFMQLAYDHLHLTQFQPEEGAEDSDYALPAEDEGQAELESGARQDLLPSAFTQILC